MFCFPIDDNHMSIFDFQGTHWSMLYFEIENKHMSMIFFLVSEVREARPLTVDAFFSFLIQCIDAEVKRLSP